MLLRGLLPFLVAAASFAGAEDDDAADGRLTVIRARRVITVGGQTYSPGMVILEDGKVRLVGRELEYPKAARVIDAAGETVMPGLVLSRSRHGLPAYSRNGVNGSRAAADEAVLSEIDFDELLGAGFTSVCLIPDGSGIPGSASVYRIGGKDGPELLERAAYLRVTMTSPARDRGVLAGALEKARKEIEKVKKAREEWEKKQAQAKEGAKPQEKGPTPPSPRPAPTPPKRDFGAEEGPAVGEVSGDEPGQPPQPQPTPKPEPPPKPEAEAEKKPEEFTPPAIDPDVQPLVDILEGKEVRVVFELSSASDLHHLDAVLERYPEVKGSYSIGARGTTDFGHVVDLLGERASTVVLEPSLNTLPYTVNRFSLAADLASAGCRPVFVPVADTEREFRLLRTRVGELVRAGLTRETALRALTIDAAALLGLEGRLGSIEKGRDADLIFLDGDPLRPGTEVTRVMVGGELVWRREPGS